MELVPKAEFSIVTRANKAWIPELIAAASPEVTETYIAFFHCHDPQSEHSGCLRSGLLAVRFEYQMQGSFGRIVALATRRRVLVGSGETGLRN